jgi:hypothetical protein
VSTLRSASSPSAPTREQRPTRTLSEFEFDHDVGIGRHDADHGIDHAPMSNRGIVKFVRARCA